MDNGTQNLLKNLHILNVTTVAKCQNLKVIQRIYLKYVNSEDHVLKCIHKLYEPFKYDAQIALFKDPVRTAL
jgi:hypothetical protein